jgi:hypothetical protein
MQIVVYSWRGADLLEGKPYTHNQVLEGNEADAGRIAGELFALGLNVMLHRNADGIVVAVDNYRFTQR